jgi:hypothetical protein
MYPDRDFRYLVNQPNVSDEMLIRSLAREPFTEILNYWNVSQKSTELLEIYRKGIEDAISRDRYPLYQLENIDAYPEFSLSVLNGLKRLWASLRFSINDSSLLIDSINGQNINISLQNKLRIMEIIPYRMSIILLINGEPKTIGIFTSKHAEKIYQQVHRLQKS